MKLKKKRGNSGEKRGEDKRGCQGKEGNNQTQGSGVLPKEKTPYQKAYWPRGFLHFISQLDEPNIFTGTHVMEEYHMGDKLSKGPTLDSVADYIADLVRKRRGDSMGASAGCSSQT